MRKALSALLLAVLIWVASPWAVEYAAPIFTHQDLQTPPVAAILAHNDVSQHDELEVVLYFRYMQTPYLAQEARRIQVPRDQTVEWGIVQALVGGPAAESLELGPLFWSNVSLLRVEREGDMVSVVLSPQFLDKPADAPEDWAQYTFWVQEAALRRRLAVQSIANALTEGARCAQVQILVAAAEGDVHGTRLTRKMLYEDELDATLLLPPQTRQEQVILTPAVTLRVMMDAWQSKDWMRLYGFLKQDAPDQAPLPSQTEFLSYITDLDPSLLNYKVSAGTISVDGATATLCADLQVMQKRGQTKQWSQIPLVLTRERGSWKMHYSVLLGMMTQ